MNGEPTADKPHNSLYDHRAIDAKWQAYWQANRTFVPEQGSAKPKYYVLDMFPYPSGAGLHVGHPLGYIATDIVARYRWLKGYNVLHPMGFDAFGLPAENYAIETGTHPAITTERNINRYKEQMSRLGMAYDPDSELRTSDAHFYKWTQWIFLKLFGSWYNLETDKAEPIETLIEVFKTKGNGEVKAVQSPCTAFSGEEWSSYTETERSAILLSYRLAYLSYDRVNWCPALGTVLANEEVKDGLSERGGYPVERILMRQWSLRITAYADRLAADLDLVDWPHSVVEMQRNWIGKSIGAEVSFTLEKPELTGGKALKVFTTRADTIFGVTLLVLAPEHELVAQLLANPDLAPEVKAACEAYIQKVSSKSERERISEVKTVSGVFTGSYAIHPFTGEKLPIWLADYVLIGYGEGAIMAVPAHDERDYAFAKHFGLPIREVVAGGDVHRGAYVAKDGKLVNSDFLNGLEVKQAISKAIAQLEAKGLGRGRVTYRLRDAIFSRQRYWGEPFPMVYKEGEPYPIDVNQLPVTLPEVESYKPTGTGESPLAAITAWVNLPDGTQRETNTMPGWAGSSWYFLRYADAQNDTAAFTPANEQYWMPVDLYIGGSEHAVGHLLYSRFWHKFLFDLGLVHTAEPFKKLVNQGMIQGRSSLVYKRRERNSFVSATLLNPLDEVIALHADVRLVHDDVLDIEAFKRWRPEYADATFELDNGRYTCGVEIEKMSKSLYNVVNPDDLTEAYGADTFRLYEMFLGPLEQSKPWNTNGITGVAGFLRRLWRLFYDEQGGWLVTTQAPPAEALRSLHQTIKKTEEDIERLSFNTAVPQFMIFVNELTRLNCHAQSILEPFLIVLAPFAPHITEELWQRLGHASSIAKATFPAWDERYLVQHEVEYPISINGKVRMRVTLPADMQAAGVEAAVRELEELQKYTQGLPIRRVIVVPGKIVNLVV